MGPIAVVRKPLPLPLPPLPCESNTKVSKFDRNSISYCFDRGVVHVVPRENIRLLFGIQMGRLQGAN